MNFNEPRMTKDMESIAILGLDSPRGAPPLTHQKSYKKELTFCDKLYYLWKPIKFLPTEIRPDGDCISHIIILPEAFRMWFYLLFIVYSGLAYIITITYVDLDYENNIIIDTFGSNNICLYYDYPPFNYFGTTLWFFVSAPLLLYLIFDLMRIYDGYLDDSLLITKEFAIYYCISTIYEILACIFFFQITATSPFENMAFHAVPYVFFSVQFFTTSLKRFLYFDKVKIFDEYKKHYGKVFRVLFLLYVSLLGASAIFRLFTALPNALGAQIFKIEGFEWTNPASTVNSYLLLILVFIVAPVMYFFVVPYLEPVKITINRHRPLTDINPNQKSGGSEKSIGTGIEKELEEQLSRSNKHSVEAIPVENESDDDDDDDDEKINMNNETDEIIGVDLVVKDLKSTDFGYKANDCCYNNRFFNFLLLLLSIICNLIFFIPCLLICFLLSYICCCSRSTNYGSRRYTPDSTLRKDLISELGNVGSCICCGCCCCSHTTSNFFSQWRLHLIIKRDFYFSKCCFCGVFGLIWYLSDCVCTFYQTIELFLFKFVTKRGQWKPITQINGLANRYGDYFPLISGIGCANSKIVLSNLNNMKQKRGFSLGNAHLSNAWSHFGKYASAFKDTNDKQHPIGRNNCAMYMKSFSSNISDDKDSTFKNKLMKTCRTILENTPFQIDFTKEKQVTREIKATMTSHILEMYFVLMFHDVMKEERSLLTMSDINVFGSVLRGGVIATFIPNRVHFFLGGFAFDRYLNRSLICITKLFQRIFLSQIENNGDNSDNGAPGETLDNIIKFLNTPLCKKYNLTINDSIAQFIVQFLTGALAGTGFIVSTCLYYLFEDPQKYIAMYEKNKYRFIIEASRTSSSLSWTVLTEKEEEFVIGGKKCKIPKNTLLALIHLVRNCDPSIFGNDANEFNPDRDNLLKETACWNAPEKLFHFNSNNFTSDNSENSQRYCPGHDSAIFVSIVIVDYYIQQIKNTMKQHT